MAVAESWMSCFTGFGDVIVVCIVAHHVSCLFEGKVILGLAEPNSSAMASSLVVALSLAICSG